MKKVKKIGIASAIILIFVLVYHFSNKGTEQKQVVTQKTIVSNQPNHSEPVKKQIWTCSMHPQIRQDHPGKCPICGMDLIPVKNDDFDPDGPRQISISESAKKLAQIMVTPVVRKFVDKEISMVGKIDFDETRLKYITAWIPGRLDRVYVDYTGITVKKGDHMVKIYSPKLYASQEELLQAIKTYNSIKDKQFQKSANSTVLAAREKLRLYGLSNKQINLIEKSKNPSYFLNIYAPIGGTIIQKSAFEGMYVKTGTRIYTIADLKHLWIRLDAYESDIAWLRLGQKVDLTTNAYPDKIFTGRISFIDPVLDKKTRTIKIRVNIENKDLILKPQMFVKATVKIQITDDGKVFSKELSNKWIGPMHPEIISDKPGKCPICGMDLVKAESLGYLNINNKKVIAPLIIPASAPLITGKRAVVYVEVPGKSRPTYEGREIVLGYRVGDYYIVKSGLKEGELVVTNGNFKIDSAVQIEAKPSMMNPDGGTSMTGHNHNGMKMDNKSTKAPDKFIKQIDKVYNIYFKLQSSLAKDDVKSAKNRVKDLSQSIKMVDMKLLSGNLHNEWMTVYKSLNSALEKILKVNDIEQIRKSFILISKDIISIQKTFGHYDNRIYYEAFCPMADNNNGAPWLQLDKDIKNPFYGSSMLTCGDITNQYDNIKK